MHTCRAILPAGWNANVPACVCPSAVTHSSQNFQVIEVHGFFFAAGAGVAAGAAGLL
jgi:hypothetical protein